jgi:glycerol-3-phosphate dehydrogenase
MTRRYCQWRAAVNFFFAVSRLSSMDAEVAVIGAGVVGCATALALARRGVSVALLEAAPEPGLGASGTNSGVLHTGFDSVPGELETELILRSAALRDPILAALGVPVLQCGALMRPADQSQHDAVAALAANAERNGVEASLRDDGGLKVPGEAVTDPVAYTLALAAAASLHGAELRASFRVDGVERRDGRLVLRDAGRDSIRCRVAVNCAGLGADEVARLAGDDSFEVYPRKGEFLVFDPPDGERLERILLPVPTKRTKGVLVFPTLDGKVVAGPTAVDQEDKGDWSVRPEARDEILATATAMYPPLEDAEPVAAYAGLRPAGRGVNYLIGPSRACPGLITAAAIRSTGLSASLGIAEHMASLVSEQGITLKAAQPLAKSSSPGVEATGPWWLRAARYRGLAS